MSTTQEPATVAYLTKRFPRLSDILDEILGLGLPFSFADHAKARTR